MKEIGKPRKVRTNTGIYKNQIDRANEKLENYTKVPFYLKNNV